MKRKRILKKEVPSNEFSKDYSLEEMLNVFYPNGIEYERDGTKERYLRKVKDYMDWCRRKNVSIAPRHRNEIANIENREAKIREDETKARAEYYLWKDKAERNKSQSSLSNGVASNSNQKEFVKFAYKKTKILKTKHLEPLFKFLCRNEPLWVNDFRTFKCRKHNAQAQFYALARHLFTKYKIPPFFDNIWDMPTEDPMFNTYFLWYRQLGNGASVRNLEHSPIALTKKMAHEFTKAPVNYSIFEALRWGQIYGMGGDERLVVGVNASRINNSPSNNIEFWNTVIKFFADRPMLDPSNFPQIYDFILAVKFQYENILDANGFIVETAPPPQPNFNMKGRTADRLLLESEEWHNARSSNGMDVRRVYTWSHYSVPDFEIKEGTKNDKLWTITELLDSRQLFEEGKRMKHCVYSYVKSCVDKRVSIWSLRLNDERKATIEVDNKSKTIKQVKARCNNSADSNSCRIIRQWASRHELNIASYAGINY